MSDRMRPASAIASKQASMVRSIGHRSVPRVTAD
jgi:hypothetical protein